MLVVDDEPGTVEVLCMVLSDAGFRASGAANGEEALSEMNAEVPDFVLLDLVMPVMDGGETLRVLRADPRWKGVSVIMMSGIPESMVRRRASGYDDFLRKPFSLEALVATIRGRTGTARHKPRR